MSKKKSDSSKLSLLTPEELEAVAGGRMIFYRKPRRGRGSGRSAG